MQIYGAGYAAIFVIFAILYWRAARRAVDATSRFWARVLIGHSLVYVLVAGISVGLATYGSPRYRSLSGLSYGLIGPLQAIYHSVSRRFREPGHAPTPSESPGNATH
jgi:hypothetical protein